MQIPFRRITASFIVLVGTITPLVYGQADNGSQGGQTWTPSIPKTWDDHALADLELPLTDSKYSPVHIPSEFYDKIPVRTILKSYPVYHPDHEPPGYLDDLRRRAPKIVFDPENLKTKEDWIRAGELIFHDPTVVLGTVEEAGWERIRDPKWHDFVKPTVTKDGILPFYRYTIRRKGEIKLEAFSCAACHSRVMPDGSVLLGGQGNFPMDRAVAYNIQFEDLKRAQAGQRLLYAADWTRKDEEIGFSLEEIVNRHRAIPPGVMARHRADSRFPISVPDLFHLQDRRYLDRTGLVQHRGIGDLMRYAALNQGGDLLSRFGDFTPITAVTGGFVPPPNHLQRYSDEQLYALSLYVYSLQPPPNPNQADDLTRRGKAVFFANDCQRCHTPPHYTNHKLTPAEGFDIPARHFRRYEIEDEGVGTDQNLTMRTRRGTGYYKVPTLRNIWARDHFGHDGACKTLEDWFDPQRLETDHRPTGFIGYGTSTHSVPGHEYGLGLPKEDRMALIAFLRTL